MQSFVAEENLILLFEISDTQILKDLVKKTLYIESKIIYENIVSQKSISVLLYKIN